MKAETLKGTARLRICAAVALTGMVLAGCSERNVLGPEGLVPTDQVVRKFTCEANVRAGTVTCADVTPAAPAGVNADRIIGGQDIFVRLANTNTGYDSGTEIFSTDVTVQNLVQHSLGTPDGSTLTGIRVFFQDGPTVTAGTGTASVIADGTGTFTAADQPFYLYNQILAPLEISNARTWMFNVPNTATSFTFAVYIAAEISTPSAPLIEISWMGAMDQLWTNSANWTDGAMPDGTTSATVPPQDQFSGSMPMLEADAGVMNLRVGAGSTLDLATHRIDIGGNLDAPGAIMNGATRMTGTDRVLRGTVHALEMTGSAKLQGEVTATGAVSISGSLTTNGHALNIIIP